MMSSGDLMCSICLDVFNDPVSTPCGHNFCKICLSSYWNNSEDCRCPNCNEKFNQGPDLKINTTLRDVVDEHKKKSHEEQPEAEVVCDICTEGKLKAVKSCLVCQISYCETHLESHLRVSGLQKHKLIDPVKNLQDYICQKHDRPLELFCRDDHTCVCLSCTEGDHKNHNTVPIRESELQEMMEERQTGAETQDEYVIKYLEQEISEMKKKNIKLQMIAEKQRAAETKDKCLIKDLKKEITVIQWRNNELEIVKQKQITAENVIKVQDQEITDLKKRNIELKKRDDELKMRDDELEMRDAELKMVMQKQITAENLSKLRDQEITDLKKRNTELKKKNFELMMVNQKRITEEDVIKVQDHEIRVLKQINIVLRKREAEMEMVKQKQIIAENVFKVRDQEITHLKKRNIEQQQKISNTEDNLVLRQGKHQEYLSRLQKSSSEDLCSRIVGIVLLVLFIIASALVRLEFTGLQMRNSDLETEMLRCKAVRLEMVQKEFTELQKRNCDLEPDMQRCKAELHLKLKQVFAVDVTLDPDTAHPNLILSDDKKQVRDGDIRHELPDNPKRFDRCVNVLVKEGFSSGRFYYEVQVKGKTEWILGVIRESVNRKGVITRTPYDGFWTVMLRNENEYKALTGPPVSLSLSVKPQKVGVFVDYEEGLVSFYNVENRSHIYSFTGQSFTEKLYPYFSPGLNYQGKNSEPLIITPVIN